VIRPTVAIKEEEEEEEEYSSSSASRCMTAVGTTMERVRRCWDDYK
jgi:hypothetical protein